MITQEQWDLIDGRYGKLMGKICHKISGDNALCTVEDNLQDLRLAAVEAVIGYSKQKGGINGSFNDFWGSVGFDKYIKTCLWNHKNNKGAKITKKKELTWGVATIENNPEVMDMAGSDLSFLEDRICLDDISKNINDTQRKVIHEIAIDHSYIKPNGKINMSKIARALGIPRHQAEQEINSIPELFLDLAE
tara:strand:+ start:27 stop:599 length:573 start_codon:yes stop_codon:yes gene_type:complete